MPKNDRHADADAVRSPARILLLAVQTAAFAPPRPSRSRRWSGTAASTCRSSCPTPSQRRIRAAIHSGLTITFVYDVELRRGAAVWARSHHRVATVSAGVRYDNLTRRYHVTLRADGRLEDSHDPRPREISRANG